MSENKKSVTESPGISVETLDQLPKGKEATGVLVLPRIGAFLHVKVQVGGVEFEGLYRVTLQSQLST